MLRRIAGLALSVFSLVACSSGGDSTGSGEQGNGTAGGGGAGAGASGSGGAFPGTQGDFLGSCDTRNVDGVSLGQCRDWVGDSTADLEVSCNGFDGAYAETPCPSADRVGTCTLDPVLGASAVYGYYAPTYSVEDARGHCDDLGGHFLASATGGGGSGGGGGGGNGGAASGGTASGGSPGSGGSAPCPPECFRAYECVQQCGDQPVSYGCCPCPDGMIDTLTCR